MPTTTLWRRLAAIPAVLALSATTLALTSADDSAAAATKRKRKLHHSAKVAVNQIGDPYRYGADGPRAFDCSGLTKFAYRRSGLYLPRSSRAQGHYTRGIRKENMRRGDLMFFYDGGGIYHVAMFLGWKNHHRVMIHSPYGNRDVTRAKPWTSKWRAGTLRRR